MNQRDIKQASEFAEKFDKFESSPQDIFLEFEKLSTKQKIIVFSDVLYGIKNIKNGLKFNGESK